MVAGSGRGRVHRRQRPSGARGGWGAVRLARGPRGGMGPPGGETLLSARPEQLSGAVGWVHLRARGAGGVVGWSKLLGVRRKLEVLNPAETRGGRGGGDSLLPRARALGRSRRHARDVTRGGAKRVDAEVDEQSRCRTSQREAGMPAARAR